jgi:glycosyltransferase involved in cell wall biosynthesis
MNVLFVLYHDFTANSAAHVHSLANALMESGAADCAVCVPDGLNTVDSIGGEPHYLPLLFSDVLAGRLQFSDGAVQPDIIHAWTPREINRKFIDRLPYDPRHTKLAIHLEDNEEHLTARSLGRDWRDLQQMPLEVLDANVPINISHPIRYRHFMEHAHAATVIVDKLAELVPQGKPVAEVWCSADESLFHSRPVNYDLRNRMAIPENSTVIVYPGNVHASNAAEVRSLYTAVALLNREGVPTTLVRAGRDFCDFLDLGGDWVKPYVIELGLMPHRNMAEILAMANVFVQPGKPGEFNDYRFPSKLPEFLAIGRPVVLPASNVALQMRHGEDAYIVPEANAIAITEAVTEIVRDRELAARLTAGARRFFDERLSWKRGAEKLAALYAEVGRRR